MTGRWWLLLAVPWLLAACAARPVMSLSPQVVLAGLVPGEANDRVILHIAISNPGNSAMPVTGLQYRLELAGSDFAWGNNQQSFSLPAGGEAVVEITVPGQVPAVHAGQARLDYVLSGTLFLAATPGTAAFSHAGELRPGGERTP